MKGYLRSPEGVFQLAPKVTTIGREGCDLVIQTPEVDFQHAVVEYSNQEECFVLQDLNTVNGTFVNDCRVQNAAVRLAPGDLIRFGNSNMAYELDVDSGKQQYSVLTPSHSKLMYPPVHQRTAWTQPLTVIADQAPPVVLTNAGLPNLRSITTSQVATWANQDQNVLPRPPTSIRSRPLSAGSRRPTFTDRAASATERVCVAGERNCYDRPHSAHRGTGGWVSGAPPRTITQVPQTADISILQEKEQRILRLNEEIRRLAMYETECQRKDEMIGQFRNEIGDLQGKIRERETSRAQMSMSNEADMSHRLSQLEEEVQLKRTEVHSLREQINTMRGAGEQGGISRQDFNDRVMEVNSLKTELERVRKDKNITSGLVTQMQRDMANKDTTITRITRELESIKKEIKEKDVQLGAMQAKFRRTQETKRSEEEVEAKDRELSALKLKFKSTENKLQEQEDVMKALREELNKVSSSSASDRESQKQLQSQLDSARTKCQDVERSERMVRVDLEQTSKRLERFRNRVIQVTFSTPGIRAPDTEISDDELLDTLKKIVDERTDMMRKVSDLKDSVKDASSSKKDFTEHSKKIKQQMNESMVRLQDKGQLARSLRQEIDLLSAVSLDESVSWVRDAITQLLNMCVTWECDIEKALEACGVNVKLSDDAPSAHIYALKERHIETKNYIEALRAQLSEADNKYKEELTLATEALRTELTESNTADIEALRIQHEEEMNRRIEDVKLSEEERRESMVGSEQAKVSELEASIEQLKASILERESQESDNNETTREALEAVEQYKKLEVELREQLSYVEKTKLEEITKIQAELDASLRKGNDSVDAFKEQIRQHSVTICAMEERLNKVVKKNKDYQGEISTLKQTISELRSRAAKPTAPPKPKMIIQKPAVDVVALESNMLGLQRENGDLKRQLQEQHDLVLNLRRDLAGASAKLSDMTGELSESQKQALEKSNKSLHDQQVELVSLRQQMAKLSEIIDKQSNEIKELTNDLNKQRSSLNKSKNLANDREARLAELQAALEEERENGKQTLRLTEQEGQITSELSALGAQCRGERHEQVINRQREALTELRSRVKALELSNPPLPTSDQALQQVVMLKKEVSELRASQAIQETAGGKALTAIDHHINKTRGMDSVAKAEVDHERSAHRETMESLELSEQSFLTLLRAIASSLELDDIGGLRSMAHIPRDERLRLGREREASVELLTSRIKVLMERILRKDELLQGYEKDLAKLRQAEKLADQKHSQVELLANDMRNRTEESQYLRESLQRTKDQLEQEKRLNSAIKGKKTFHLENESFSKRTWPQHHCPPEDIHGKTAANKKAAQERLKKKNYEIRTLKNELGNKERHLHETRRKLVTLESTMGLEDGRDPFEPPSAEV